MEGDFAEAMGQRNRRCGWTKGAEIGGRLMLMGIDGWMTADVYGDGIAVVKGLLLKKNLVVGRKKEKEKCDLPVQKESASCGGGGVVTRIVLFVCSISCKGKERRRGEKGEQNEGGTRSEEARARRRKRNRFRLQPRRNGFRFAAVRDMIHSAHRKTHNETIFGADSDADAEIDFAFVAGAAAPKRISISTLEQLPRRQQGEKKKKNASCEN
jgi:hypothetical protein